MDHRRHPSSSSTTTKGGKGKIASTAASSSSSSSAATNAHGDGDFEPLPPPPAPHVDRLHFYSLADIAHDAISSYLTMKEMHCMMESSQWALKAYGGRVKELTVPWKREDDEDEDGSEEEEEEEDDDGYGSFDDEDEDGEAEEDEEEEDDDEGAGGEDQEEMENQGLQPTTSASAVVLSLISRRPGLVQVTVGMDPTLDVLVEAMRKGYCDRLESIKVEWWTAHREVIPALYDALADGLCHKINKLSVPDIDDLLSRLGQALRSRMETGCSGLKSLVIESPSSSPSSSQSPIALSLLLSSGACEALEELTLDVSSGGYNSDDVSEWLSRTKAPHLRVLSPVANMDVIRALCGSGVVAPRLQVLRARIDDPSSITLLSQAIGGGAWPHLTDLQIGISRDQAMFVPDLAEAIRVGARELTDLCLYGDGIGPEEGVVVTRMLQDGGCPRLEELNLWWNDGFVMELARALEGGAPCSTTLRKLNFEDREITSAAMTELAQAMGRGALPHLEVLNLSGHEGIGGDAVGALAEAMSTGRALRSLKELHLKEVQMRDKGTEALFVALRDHKACPHLEVLNLIFTEGIYEAIEVGALQQLRELYLPRMNTDEEGFYLLIKAIVAQHPNPGCPRLEVLHMMFEGDLYDIDGGVMYLAEMIKVEEAMQHLRELYMTDILITGKGMKALFDALGDHHACPRLQWLRLECMLDDYDEVIERSRKWGEMLESELAKKRKGDRWCSRVRVEIDYN